MDVALVLLRKEGEKRRFTLSRDTTVIGRREDCDLRIPLGDVSRRHCSVVLQDGRALVQDLGSSNGTFVNGQRVQEQELAAGDAIRIGSLLFVVQVDDQPPLDSIDPSAQPVNAAAAPAGAAALNPTVASEVGDAHLDPSDAAEIHGEDFDPFADSGEELAMDDDEVKAPRKRPRTPLDGGRRPQPD